MRFKQLLLKMAPTLGKGVLVSEVEQTLDILKTTTIPAWKGFQEVMSTHKTPCVAVVDYEKKYKGKLKKGSPYKNVFIALENMVILSEYMVSAIEDKFAEDLTRSSLSAYALNILKLTSIISFASRYARNLAVYLVNCQNVEETGNEDDKPNKADTRFVEENLYPFLAVVDLFNTPAKELVAKLEDIPDLIVNEENVETQQAVAGADIDPLKMNFISPRYNPFMFWNSRRARYQADKYKQAQADLQEIQCRLLLLKQKQQNKNDAKLEKQIEYYTNLNNKLKAEIEDMEEEYGLND